MPSVVHSALAYHGQPQLYITKDRLCALTFLVLLNELLPPRFFIALVFAEANVARFTCNDGSKVPERYVTLSTHRSCSILCLLWTNSID